MKRFIIPALLGSSLLAPCAFAQVTGLEGTETVSNDIIVTARRRDERLQDIPQVVNAVTDETLKKLNILDFEDVQAVVPGLTLSADGVLSRAALRGVSFLPETRTSGTVEFYYNDALVESNFLFKSLYDVGQIEVLRGPQGTLRGRSAPSGAITITTRAPNVSEIGGYMSMSGTHLGGINAQGAINVPLIQDVLALRVAGVVDQNDLDGVRSINGGAKPRAFTRSFRTSLRFEPTDGIRATVTYQWLKENLDAYTQVFGSGAPAFPTHPAGYNGPVITPGQRLAITNQPNRASAFQQVLVGNVELDLGGHRLSYVGSYSSKDNDEVFDGDPGNMLPNAAIFSARPNKFSQMTHEARLSSTERLAGLFDYTLGAFYSRQTIDSFARGPQAFLPGSFGSPLLAVPDPYSFNPRYQPYRTTSLIEKQRELSFFGNVTLHLGDKTEFSGGGRYIIYKNDSRIVASLLPTLVAVNRLAPQCATLSVGSTYPGTCDLPGTAIGIPVGVQATIPARDRFDPFVYNLSLSHKFSDDLMVYASLGTAWRRGLDTSAEISDVTNNVVLRGVTLIEPETSKTYEIGIKSTWFYKRLRINVTAFHQTFDGLIFRTQPAPYITSNGITAPSVVTRPWTVNADAVINGIDAEVSFDVTPRWNITAAFSYADGKVNNTPIPCQDSNFDGTPDTGTVTVGSFPAGSVISLCNSRDPISQNPLWNLNLQSEFNFPVSEKVDGFIRGLLNYYPSNDRRNIGFVVQDYALLNVYAGIRDPKGAWEVSAFAKNATGTNTQLSRSFEEIQSPSQIQAAFGPSGYRTTSYTPRFETGLTVRYAFGAR